MNNPYLIGNGERPFLLSTESVDYNYIISSKHSFKLKKEEGTIDAIVEMNEFSYSSNFIHIVSKTFKNFIIDKESNKFYNINYGVSIEFLEESGYSNLFENSENEILGSIARVKDINEDEMKDSHFIIYGISKDKLFFYTNDKTFYYSKELENINDKLSCKFIEEDFFVCLIFIDYKINFYYIMFKKEVIDMPLNIIYSDSLYTGNLYSDLAFYDTSERNLKFLCATMDGRVDCIFFKVKYNEQNKNHYFLERILSFNTNFFSQKNCDFTEFNSDYLFCCGDIDSIICLRIDKRNFNYTEFYIHLEGKIAYLNIQSSADKIIFYYLNENGDGNSINQYYIYKPTCEDIYYIFTNKLRKISTNLLFIIRTNKYYLEFENLNEYDIGFFTIDNNEFYFNERSAINNNNNSLDFKITNKENFNYNENYTFYYSLSVEESSVYSTKCLISIKFEKNCYESCKECSVSKDYFTAENHNCLSCRDNYYKSPIKVTNCYSKEEKREEWYFDEIEEVFGVCNIKCKTCFGPSENECLSCKDELYLYNNKCLENENSKEIIKIEDSIEMKTQIIIQTEYKLDYIREQITQFITKTELTQILIKNLFNKLNISDINNGVDLLIKIYNLYSHQQVIKKIMKIKIIYR